MNLGLIFQTLPSNPQEYSETYKVYGSYFFHSIALGFYLTNLFVQVAVLPDFFCIFFYNENEL